MQLTKWSKCLTTLVCPQLQVQWLCVGVQLSLDYVARTLESAEGGSVPVSTPYLTHSG